MLQKVINAITDIIYPRACPICGKAAPVVDGERLQVCVPCQEKLRYIGESYCLQCGKELRRADEQYCYDCGKIKHHYEQGAAAFVYTEGIKQSIYRYKYKGRREYARWYGRVLADRCGARIRMWNPDVIVPVPLHREKLKKRGYNQAELVANELGKRLGIPVDGDYLVRRHNTAPMKELTSNERLKNLKNAFIITNNDVKYNKILIVDDIYTTGATVDACADVLKEYGAKEVYCVSLCVGRGI